MNVLFCSCCSTYLGYYCFFFFNDTPTTEIYTYSHPLALHDALPISLLESPEGEVTIGVVGKYVGLQDSYKSHNEALVHGGIANRVKVNIRWIDAELFEAGDSDIASKLEPCHAILVPGAFGSRGAEGKIASVRFAREHGVPYFGISSEETRLNSSH